MTDTLTDEQIEDELLSRMMGAELREAALIGKIKDLLPKAKALVDMLDDAERNHGALIGSKTLTAANELRIELSRWK